MNSKLEYERVVDIKDEVEGDLLSFPNVVSVGVGHKNDTDELCVSVGVTEKVPKEQLAEEDKIPALVEIGPGKVSKTDVIEVGELVPEVLMMEPQVNRQDRIRPVPQGVSVGHPDITAGTVGWLYKINDGRVFAGSNNHVMANSNDASLGDQIIQPGSADGGSVSEDSIGSLAFYVVMEDGVDVDLALAELDVEYENILAEIEAPVTGIAESISVGDELVKSGRTTAVTRGQIQQMDATVSVNYGGNLGSVQMSGCIITGDMSDGGDSGSSVAKEVNGELRAAGRLFAGSDTATVHHNINSEIGHLESGFDSTIQLLTDGGDGGGEMPTAQVTLTLTREDPDTGNIEATVNSEGDGPVPDATVSIEGPVSRSTTTGSEGTTVFSSVPIGDYTVSADKDGYGEDSTTIEAGQFD